MRIVVHHKRHYAWVVPKPGERISSTEPVMPLDDAAPHVVRVRRVFDNDRGFTVVEIPDEAVTRMSREQAWKELSREQREAGVQPTTITRRHMHHAIARHLHDVVHEHHAPIEHWHDIVVESDETLQHHLRVAHLESHGGSVGA